MKRMNVENVSIRMIQLQNNLKNTSGKLKIQVDPSLRMDKENNKRCLGSLECKIATIDDDEQENKDFELNIVVDGLYFSDEEIQITNSVKRFIIISLFLICNQ